MNKYCNSLYSDYENNKQCSSLYSEYENICCGNDYDYVYETNQSNYFNDIRISEILEYYCNKDFHPREHFKIYQLPINNYQKIILKKQWDLQLTNELERIKINKKRSLWRRLIKK